MAFRNNYNIDGGLSTKECTYPLKGKKFTTIIKKGYDLTNNYEHNSNNIIKFKKKNFVFPIQIWWVLKILSNNAIAGIIGIVLAHIVADFIAALADPHLKSAAFGIVIGGFLPLTAVPFLEKYVTKSRYHTVVGDHEDLKKDLKRKHK